LPLTELSKVLGLTHAGLDLHSVVGIEQESSGRL